MAELSKFNERADGAAEALKNTMGIAPTKVEVGPDGRPPAPPPPPGSYAAMMREQQRAEAEAKGNPLGDQPVAGTVDNMVDGSVAPPTPPAEQQTPGSDPSESPNVQRRFQELTQRLRVADQEKQAAEMQAKNLSSTNKELTTRLDAIEQQHQTMLQENLESMDPETRAMVMQDARMSELMAGVEKRLMDSIMPHVQGLEQANTQRSMMELGSKYPAFDIQIHGPLIDMFRGKNPHCSVDQAYRAIAEEEELVTRTQSSSTPIPPTVAPGGAGNGIPRYVPQPESNPETEMVEDARLMAKLRASSNPEDNKRGLRLADKNIQQRLSRQFGWDS
jgi:hypothetical protein